MNGSHSLRWHDSGLGFDFDWGGLITSVVTAGASYAVAKKQTDAKTAELKTQLAAQDALNKQLLLASQQGATGVIQPPPVGVIQGNLAAMAQQARVAPGQPYVWNPQASAPLPSWVVPAAVVGALALVALMVTRPRAAAPAGA